MKHQAVTVNPGMIHELYLLFQEVCNGYKKMISKRLPGREEKEKLVPIMLVSFL